MSVLPDSTFRNAVSNSSPKEEKSDLKVEVIAPDHSLSPRLAGFAGREQWQNLKTKLADYGLSSKQAEIYLTLLSTGPVSIHSLSELSSMHRSDLYRKIKELRQMQMVEVIIGSPANRYKAASPRNVILLLDAKIKQSYKDLLKNSIELAKELDGIEKRPLESQQRSRIETSSFTLISGRKRYWHETKNMVRKAEREILRIVDENGLKTMFTADLFGEFKLASKRGVSVRLISEITDANLRESKICSKYFQIKHLEGVTLRFIDVDSRGVILCGSLPHSSQDPTFDQGEFLKFHDPTFGETMKFFFDELWTIARPFEGNALALTHQKKS